MATPSTLCLVIRSLEDVELIALVSRSGFGVDKTVALPITGKRRSAFQFDCHSLVAWSSQLWRRRWLPDSNPHSFWRAYGGLYRQEVAALLADDNDRGHSEVQILRRWLPSWDPAATLSLYGADLGTRPLNIHCCADHFRASKSSYSATQASRSRTWMAQSWCRNVWGGW